MFETLSQEIEDACVVPVQEGMNVYEIPRHEGLNVCRGSEEVANFRPDDGEWWGEERRGGC